MGNYLGGQPGMQEISPETAALIDQDISDLIDDAQKQAIEILTNNRAALDKIAEQLQEHEEISGNEVHRIARELGQPIATETT
jgi:cell division protease FtsH